MGVSVCSQKYDITLVSPRNYFLYTPLLPAVATGTVEERSIVEPIRRIMAGKVPACFLLLPFTMPLVVPFAKLSALPIGRHIGYAEWQDAHCAL